MRIASKALWVSENNLSYGDGNVISDNKLIPMHEIGVFEVLCKGEWENILCFILILCCQGDKNKPQNVIENFRNLRKIEKMKLEGIMKCH